MQETDKNKPGNGKKTGLATNAGFKKGLIINILLFIGLMVLYGIHFFGNGSGSSAATPAHQPVDDTVQAIQYTIAYVDNELIIEQYALAIKMRDELQEEQQRLESDLTRRQRNFQTEVDRFQRDVQSGNLGMERAQQKEQELMQLQQDLLQLNETYSERLARKEFELNRELFEIISEFLKKYNQEKGYDFILGYSMGGGILYADKTYDITTDVIEKLNREYETTN